jgi:hypothetical protein
VQGRGEREVEGSARQRGSVVLVRTGKQKGHAESAKSGSRKRGQSRRVRKVGVRKVVLGRKTRGGRAHRVSAKVGKSRVGHRRCAFRSQLLPINVYLFLACVQVGYVRARSAM